MPLERRERVIAIWLGSTGKGRNPMFNGRRQPSCGGTSRMTRECQVRFCERLGVRFPGPTRHELVLCPGVITHASNIVEHPELIAERIIRFANLVGSAAVDAGLAESICPVRSVAHQPAGFGKSAIGIDRRHAVA
jgi:hypothetical protein